MNPIQIAQIPFREGFLKYNKLAKGPYDKDIIPGVYEGGYKVWECTMDLLKHMAQNKIDFTNKKVLDIGCGHGLLGIAALKSGAAFCYFQDYNKQVLEQITKANIIINDIQIGRCKFISGDWDTCNAINEKFDYILGSELIYKEQNYEKISNICKRLLQPSSGIALLANKHYYFGVGGNIDDFKESLDKNGLTYQTKVKINPPKGGNKKQIIGITLQNKMGQ